MEKIIFCFLVFKESLFEVNYQLILANFSFSVGNNFCMFQWVEKRLVTSANIIGSNMQDLFLRSLTCHKNSNGPEMEPRCPPHFSRQYLVLEF